MQLDPELLAHSEPLTEWAGNPLPLGTVLITHPLFNEVMPRLIKPGQEEGANMALVRSHERLAEVEKRGAWEEAIFLHAPDHQVDAFMRYEENLQLVGPQRALLQLTRRTKLEHTSGIDALDRAGWPLRLYRSVELSRELAAV